MADPSESSMLNVLRLINQQYGPMTDRTRAGVGREAEMRSGYLPTTGERIGNAVLDYGPIPAKIATAIAMQPVNTGYAMADAYEDPSVGKLANAGAQMAMNLFQPAKAAGILLGGAGVVGAKQLFGSSAEASGLSPEQQARKAQLQKQIEKSQWNSAAQRRAVESELGDLRKIETDAATAENSAKIEAARVAEQNRLESERKAKEQKQTEYNTAVDTAIALRDAERKRDTRWSDTPLGKYYNETGGAPTWGLLFAGGAGVLDRLAKGAPKTRGDYGRLAAEGTGAASVPINAPLVYNAAATEPDNPQRRALEVYARELPNDHPEKQYWMEQAQTMPQANPVKTTAQAELYDPLKMAERVGMAFVEGAPSAMTGANLPGAIGAIGRGAQRALGNTAESVGALPGNVATGYQRGMGQAATERGNTAIARQVAADSEATVLEARRRLGEQRALAQEPVPAAPVSQGQLPPPAQGQLPPPVPVQNPSPNPQPQSGLIIPNSITDNKARTAKTYGEKDSARTQQYLIDQAEKGKTPSGVKIANDADISPTRAKYVMQNLREIAAANNLDISDPKVLRAIATELNANPAYRNTRGTGNRIFSVGGGLGVGYGALPGDEQ
jgi:hypothetical protein